MTAAPEHSDQLATKIAELVGAAVGDLNALIERVRAKLARLALNPDALAGPALAAIVADVLDEMAAAARAAKRAGSDPAVVDEALQARRARMTSMARALTRDERPSLAKALLVLQQGVGLASYLTGAISDRVVSDQTAARLDALRRNQVAMWVPERDACARCLRYAGLRIIRPGDGFPAGLSYDPNQHSTDAGTIAGPPLHPHCRCELQLVAKGDSEGASEALQREAERAIMKGWALASEGQASRRRAAQALLAQKTILAPVSVRREAAKRLSEGERFTRPVPSGSETPAEKRYLRSYSGVYRR